MARSEEEREKLLILLLASMEDVHNKLVDVFKLSSKPDIVKVAFDLLAVNHTVAAYIGRGLVTDPITVNAVDCMIGEAMANKQLPFLEKFVDDVVLGGLSAEAISARAELYGHALYGTVNRVWAASQSPNTLIWWDLGPNENHCTQCPIMASNSPYKADELTTFPGDGNTDCVTNCKCTLRTETEEGPRIWTV